MSGKDQQQQKTQGCCCRWALLRHLKERRERTRCHGRALRRGRGVVQVVRHVAPRRVAQQLGDVAAQRLVDACG